MLLLLAQAVLLESALSASSAPAPSARSPPGAASSPTARTSSRTAWWLVTLPGLVIALLVVGVNLLGDGLRDRVAPQGEGCLR